MTCRPMFCEGKADCGDKHCPGHPVNSDEAFDRRIQEAETRRQQETELRWQCRDQMSAAQLYEHERAGEIGYESAQPDLVRPPSIAVPYTTEGPHRKPMNWSAVSRWGAAVALCVLWTVLVIYAR